MFVCEKQKGKPALGEEFYIIQGKVVSVLSNN